MSRVSTDEGLYPLRGARHQFVRPSAFIIELHAGVPYSPACERGGREGGGGGGSMNP